MALRGKKGSTIEKRLKCLFYGVAGAGKTTAAISFPGPYIVDAERGSENSQYLKLIDDRGGAIFQSSDFNEVITEVKSLLSEKHEYKTLIIDPLTVIYDQLVDQAASRGIDATAFGRHYVEANKQIKRLLQLLLRLDMNVIITSHAKNEYGKDMSVLGSTFDCYKKLDYLFDLVIEIRKVGLKRIGIVKKTRIATFEEGSDFDFSYDIIADKYGRDVIERQAIAEALASSAQLIELDRLIKLLKLTPDITDKWLIKCGCTTFSDMSSETIAKCIENLQRRVEGKE